VLLLHLITLNDTHSHHHTLARTALDERSARRRILYPSTYRIYVRHPRLRLDSHPHSQQAIGRKPTCGHWDRPYWFSNPTDLGRYVGVWMMEICFPTMTFIWAHGLSCGLLLSQEIKFWPREIVTYYYYYYYSIKSSRADTRVKVWKFSTVSGTDCVPILQGDADGW